MPTLPFTRSPHLSSVTSLASAVASAWLCLAPLGCSDDAASESLGETEEGSGTTSDTTTGPITMTEPATTLSPSTSTGPQPTGSTTEPDTDSVDNTGTDTTDTTDTDEPSTSTGDPAECGDGVMDGDEACDGDDLGDAACPVTGELSCTARCELDLTACEDTLLLCSTPASTIDGTTTVDTPNLDAITVTQDLFVTDVNVAIDISHTHPADVTSLVFSPGAAANSLLFSGRCGLPDDPFSVDDIDAVFDDDGAALVCAEAPPSIAGTLLPQSELHDLIGAPSGGEWTLATVDSFSAEDDGLLNEWCLEVSLSEDDPVECGDGIAHFGEACDAADLNETRCVDLDGFIAGDLGCADDCTFDTSSCIAPGCDNLIVEPGEDCEGKDLGGTTCADLDGFFAGELDCGVDCLFDTSSCIASVCSNDVAEGDEVCDGPDLNGTTCADFGFGAGTPVCNDGCDGFDTSDCSMPFWADDFEAGPTFGFEWLNDLDAPWMLSSDAPQEGLRSMQSGVIGNDGSTSIRVVLDYENAGNVSFWYRTSTEETFDELTFYIDDVAQSDPGQLSPGWSGDTDWTQTSFDVEAGTHTLRWQYRKDGSGAGLDDTVWVDDIRTVGAQLAPQ